MADSLEAFVEELAKHRKEYGEGTDLAWKAAQHWADFFGVEIGTLLNCGFRGGRHRGQDSGYTDYNNSPIDHHAFFVYRGVDFEIIATEGYLVVSCLTHPALVNNSTAEGAKQTYTPRQLLLAMVAQINMTTQV